VDDYLLLVIFHLPFSVGCPHSIPSGDQDLPPPRPTLYRWFSSSKNFKESVGLEFVDIYKDGV
jgi:hypothetical protein